MLQTDFRLKDIQCIPSNHSDLQIELNFDQDSPDARVSTNEWRFVERESQKVNAVKDSALTAGSESIFEAAPFDVIISDGSQTITLQQMLDLRTAVYSCEEVKCKGLERGKVDWINQNADAFRMSYLNEQTTFLPDSLNKFMPYVINSVPDYQQLFMALLSTVFVVQEITKIITDITAATGEMANPLQAATIIRVVFLVIYATTLLIALAKLIKQMIDLLIQPVKYHACMLLKDQLIAGCAYLGKEFKSTVFIDDPVWSRIVVMPRKLQNPENSTNANLLGFTSSNILQKGYFEGTFGDLIRLAKQLIRGKLIIEDNIVRIERADYNTSIESYTIPDLYNPFFTFNAEEMQANILVEFLTDSGDKNTVQEYIGTIFEVTTTPKKITNKDCRMVSGFDSRTIPLALAKQKRELNKIEEVVKEFLTVVTNVMNILINSVNAVIGIINDVTDFINTILKVLKLVGIKKEINIPAINSISPVDFGSIVNDRIGMMILETDFVTVPRIFLFQQGISNKLNKIDPNNDTLLSARNLWNEFHYIDSFVPSTGFPNANQWIRKTVENVRFSFSDFLLVKNNNRIFDASGNVAKIESLKWNPWKQTAIIQYRINRLYDNNLKETVSEGKGY